MGILERRFTELGRIRIGDKVEISGKKGVTRPNKLEHFRLTSQNKPRLEYAAKLWGGTVEQWEDAPQGTQWELYTECNSLPVVVPPFNALSQSNEIWQGGECRLRCDGATIVHCAKEPQLEGEVCRCEALPLQERLERAKKGTACHTITRLSLFLPDIPGVGVWRFETGSYYAGMELQGGAEMLEHASAEGAYIECDLQIEERRVKRRVTKGGDLQTQVFSVVTLQPRVSIRELMTKALSGGARPALAVPMMTLEAIPVGTTDVFPQASTKALLDEGWRAEAAAVLKHLVHLPEEIQEAWAERVLNPAATPGEGQAILHGLYELRDAQQTRQPGEEG